MLIKKRNKEVLRTLEGFFEFCSFDKNSWEVINGDGDETHNRWA